MGYIIFTGLLVIAALATWVTLGRFMQGAKIKEASGNVGYSDIRSTTYKAWRLGGTAAVAIFIILMTIVRSYTPVDAGHVGVVYQFGAINGQVGEGINWIAPWQSVKDANIQTQRATFEDIAAISKETQDVRARVTLNYSVSSGDVQNLYRNVGSDWFDRLVPSRVQQAFKETTVQYATVDIAPNREEVKRKTLEKLRAALAAYSVNVVDVNVENLEFNEEFTAAIEAKQVATQEAQRQQQLVAARKAEADQLIAKATGEAEANRLLSLSLRDDPRLLQLRIAETQANAIIALAKEGTVQVIPSDVLFTRPTP